MDFFAVYMGLVFVISLISFIAFALAIGDRSTPTPKDDKKNRRRKR